MDICPNSLIMSLIKIKLKKACNNFLVLNLNLRAKETIFFFNIQQNFCMHTSNFILLYIVNVYFLYVSY